MYRLDSLVVACMTKVRTSIPGFASQCGQLSVNFTFDIRLMIYPRINSETAPDSLSGDQLSEDPIVSLKLKLLK